MRSNLFFAALAALSLAIVGFILGAFTVDQTEQALVLRFGEPVAGRGLITQPGLHFKIPVIENAVFFDNRILDVESPNLEVLAADNQRLEVDSFIRYRIIDALKFYQTVNSVQGANNQLASVLNSAVRRVLSEANQQQIVRDERAALMVKIREQADQEARKFGVAVVDARIRRVDLPQQISEKVYGRMQTERQREASEYRAQGAEQFVRLVVSGVVRHRRHEHHPLRIRPQVHRVGTQPGACRRRVEIGQRQERRETAVHGQGKGGEQRGGGRLRRGAPVGAREQAREGSG